MPFDPTLPADHSLISAAELRNQFTGLQQQNQDNTDAINNLASDMNSAIGDTAKNCDGVAILGLSVSNPPTQAQVQQLANKLDELIAALHRN